MTTAPMRPVPLGRAITDPHLLGTVKPDGLWPAQVELLRDLEGPARVHVWALGRRSGKTMMAALAATHSCLLRPDLDAMVRPGETRYAIVVATSREQARILVDAARSLVEASPLLAPLIKSADVDELRFRLPSGARTALKALPCNARAVRGLPVSLVVFDEIAHFLSETEGPAVAERVFTGLMPATAQFGDQARVLLISTPWGVDGLFATEFQRASSGELEGAVARQASTADMNPTITADFLAREEARDPDAYRAEYLAQFEGSGAAYLDFERFRVAPRGELSPADGVGWVAGLDPAFSSDPFGVALVGRDPLDRRRMVVGCVRAFAPARRAASFEERDAARDEKLDDVLAVVQRFGAQAVTDQYASRAVVERLRRSGVSTRVVPMTATSKTAAYAEMRARLYDGTLEVYDEPALLKEMSRLRTRFTAGSAAVVNPRVGGSHGDMAQALALAVYDCALRGVSSGRKPTHGVSYGSFGVEGWHDRLSPGFAR